MEDSERRKAIELLKEMRTEKKGEDDKSSNQETRLNWMYKEPSDLVDREEYLLGKAIDRSFEALNSSGNKDAVGRTGEQSNVPKKLLDKTESTEQVDIAKKILEDPLYAIKQKEMEARKKLLNNPVKLKQIKQMLMERSKQNKAHKHKKKKSKTKSEQELNLLIIKKLKKFTDKEKRKALNKIMKTDIESSSTDSSSSDNAENKKRKKKRKQSSSSSSSSTSSSSSSEDSSSETSSSSDESNKRHRHKNKKRKHKRNKKKQSKKEKSSSSDSEASDSDSSDSETDKKTRNKNLKSGKSSRETSSKTQTKSKYSNSKNEKRDSGQRSKRDRTAERDEERRKVRRRDDSSDEDRKSKKNYGLMIPDGSKPEVRYRTEPAPKYEKNIEAKPKYVPASKAKPLSEKEREKKLKEMMEDAKLRKQDREKNLANHRKKQAQEEAPKDYDDDFMRRQMSHLTSQGTMAERIKSNINNIQRSRSSMDSNFMRK